MLSKSLSINMPGVYRRLSASIRVRRGTDVHPCIVCLFVSIILLQCKQIPPALPRPADLTCSKLKREPTISSRLSRKCRSPAWSLLQPLFVSAACSGKYGDSACLRRLGNELKSTSITFYRHAALDVDVTVNSRFHSTQREGKKGSPQKGSDGPQ